jgi:hypothetical protein
MSLIKKVVKNLGLKKEFVERRKKDRRKGDRRFKRNLLKKPAVYGDYRQKVERRKKDRRQG